jgi:hypothetical protein
VLCCKALIKPAQWASALGSAALIKMRYVLALPGIDIKVHLLTRIAQNSNEILAEFANQKTEYRRQNTADSLCTWFIIF